MAIAEKLKGTWSGSGMKGIVAVRKQGLMALFLAAGLVVSACAGDATDSPDTTASGEDTETTGAPGTTEGAAGTTEGAPDTTEGAPDTAGDGIEINIGIFPVISPIPVMQAQGMLEDLGYTINWVRVDAGLPGAASALAAGQLDFVHANSSSGTIIFSSEPDVAHFVGRSFINLNETVISSVSGYTDVSELADAAVVVSGLKTASTLFYELGLQQQGVTPNRNNYFIAGTGPSMVDVLASGGTEVAATYVPYSTEMEEREIGEVVFTASDALGRTEPGDGLFVTTAFAEENPQAVEDVLRAMFAAMDTIKNDPNSVIDLISEFAGVPIETIEAALEGDVIPDSYAPDVEAMVEVAQLAEDNGFAPEGVEGLADFASVFANPTFAQNASTDSE